ncbi:hypothetical protein BFS35_010755 [Macrococcoides goetzii]|uniref:O-antigen ligase-related domain-containing protein n=1 Tax=Macrococcoides goetzii TaxID=1891097 RepID=A0A395G7E9_9STAP|nr:O-antigen ligase family protein [Macrococcus goetzii]RAI79926.1 hypothetical protein BFS35_010755 [Macrococcus goetzii]
MKQINVILIFIIIQSILTEDLTSLFKMQLGNLAIPLVLIFLFLNCKNIKMSKSLLFFLLTIVFISLISMIINQTVSNSDFLRMFKVNSVLIFILFGICIKNLNDVIYIRTIFYSFITFLLIFIIQNFSELIKLNSQSRLFYMRYLNIEINTGNLFFTMLIFALALFIILNNKYFLVSKRIEIILVILIFILIITSLVRTAYIIAFIIYFYFYGIKLLNRKYVVWLGLSSIILLLFIIFIVETGYIDRILYTFSNNGESKLDNSTLYRVYLFNNTLEALQNNIINMFIGFGFVEFSKLPINNLGLESTHNGFLNITVKGGLLYLSSFITLIFYTFIKCKNKRTFSLITLLFIISNLTGDGITYIPLTQMYFTTLGICLEVQNNE